jgi:hypothetical protein
VVTVLCSPGRGASQVEKSPRLNWTTQFFTLVYDGASSRNVSVKWREFSTAPCLAGKKTYWQLASRCCWNSARRLTCFLSASVTRKDNSADEQPPFQGHYRFRPKTSGIRSGYGLISPPLLIDFRITNFELPHNCICSHKLS